MLPMFRRDSQSRLVLSFRNVFPRFQLSLASNLITCDNIPVIIRHSIRLKYFYSEFATLLIFTVEVKLFYGVEDELVFLFCWILDWDIDFVVDLDKR